MRDAGMRLVFADLELADCKTLARRKLTRLAESSGRVTTNARAKEQPDAAPRAEAWVAVSQGSEALLAAVTSLKGVEQRALPIHC